MTIYVNLRQLGKKRSTVCAVPFELPACPATVRELIKAVAGVCVTAYNTRVQQGETGVRPMTEGQLMELESIGKLAFGVNYGEKQADEAAAIAHALQGFEDGLYRVFLGQTELTALEDTITLSGQDELTFIRLTMLTGSIF